MTDSEFVIQLNQRIREDGSVLVTSPHLPLFSALGADQSDAYAVAMELLPKYLKANVPEFVDLRPVPTVDNLLLGKGGYSVPAYVLARTGDHRGRRSDGAQAT
jgi:hypothetical protein